MIHAMFFLPVDLQQQSLSKSLNASCCVEKLAIFNSPMITHGSWGFYYPHGKSVLPYLMLKPLHSSSTGESPASHCPHSLCILAIITFAFVSLYEYLVSLFTF